MLCDVAAAAVSLVGTVALVALSVAKTPLVPVAHASEEPVTEAMQRVETHALATHAPPLAWDARSGTFFAADRATPDALPFDLENAIVRRARQEVERGVGYENGYVAVSGYPMGDIRSDRSACTDVVVRSLRAAGMDLQLLVHEDVLAAPGHYRLPIVDTNIDHRRISTMHAYFARNAMSLTTDVREKDAFRPGDIVFFSWTRCPSCKLDHVGIVSDRTGPRGYRLVLENGGPHAAENDSLDRGSLVAHFRALSRP